MSFWDFTAVQLKSPFFWYVTGRCGTWCFEMPLWFHLQGLECPMIDHNAVSKHREPVIQWQVTHPRRVEISTVLEICVHTAVFWAVGQCSLVGRHHVKEQHTAFIFSPRNWGEMLFQNACTYCQITWCYKPENHKINLCHHEDFKFQKLV